MTVLRTAVVSSSALVRAGLRCALVQADGFDVVADAGTPDDVWALKGEAVDVIVAELDASLEDSMAAIAADGLPALVLLLHPDDGVPAEWLAEGVTLLSIDAPAHHISAAARAAASGLVATSRALMAGAWRQPGPMSSAGASGYESLTVREAQVLEKLAQGLGNKAIGEALHISTHTAKFHVAQIIGKLNASSRAHAVANALRAGLLEA